MCVSWTPQNSRKCGHGHQNTHACFFVRPCQVALIIKQIQSNQVVTVVVMTKFRGRGRPRGRKGRPRGGRTRLGRGRRRSGGGRVGGRSGGGRGWKTVLIHKTKKTLSKPAQKRSTLDFNLDEEFSCTSACYGLCCSHLRGEERLQLGIQFMPWRMVTERSLLRRDEDGRCCHTKQGKHYKDPTWLA